MKQLGAEEQRQIHCAGGEVPNLAEAIAQHQAHALDLIGHAIGLKMSIAVEDRLRGRIIEACVMLREGAPGKALEVLEGALRL